MNIDRKLFFGIYNFADRNKIVKNLGIFLAKYSQKIFIIIYILGMIPAFRTNVNTLARFVLIPLVTLFYNSFLRYKINRQRPFVKEGITPFIEHEKSGSCPSNHGASAMIIALGFMMINVYISSVLIVLAVITGVSRVVVGVHYPFDIIISWIIAFVIGVFGFLVL